MPQQLFKYMMYVRKSTDDKSRQVRSIDDQVAELRDLARQHELDVVDVLCEKQSAKRPGRPIFDDMLRRIEKGEAQGILAWHPDRLARNSRDGGHVIDLLDVGVLLDLRFPTFTFENSASGKLMLAMMFSQSKYYVDSLSENIKRGKRRKAIEGTWPGRPCSGIAPTRSASS
ncbi:MAG: recombinase family protein [Rhodobacteraceae bacterium]|nr:recombinase family protein [Paracoccaceae bacterium]